MLHTQKAMIHRYNFANQPTAEQLRLDALKHAHSWLRAKDFAKNSDADYRI
jgi:hypothetical protein